MNLNLKNEDAIQADIIQWARKQELMVKELGLLFHIPNGGGRSKMEGMRMKALGVRPGVPDLCLPVARRGYHGLWLEVKTETGRLSDAQKLWHLALQQQGHCVGIVRSFEEGKKAIEWYLALPSTT